MMRAGGILRAVGSTRGSDGVDLAIKTTLPVAHRALHEYSPDRDMSHYCDDNWTPQKAKACFKNWLIGVATSFENGRVRRFAQSVPQPLDGKTEG